MSGLLSGGQAFGVEGPSLTSHHVLLHFGGVPSVALALQRATKASKLIKLGVCSASAELQPAFVESLMRFQNRTARVFLNCRAHFR